MPYLRSMPPMELRFVLTSLVGAFLIWGIAVCGEANAQYRSPLKDHTATKAATFQLSSTFAHVVSASKGPDLVKALDSFGGCNTYCRYSCKKTASSKVEDEYLACDEWESYYSCTKQTYCHLGTDITAPFGHVVVAAADGDVIKVSSNACTDNQSSNCASGSNCKCSANSCNGGLGNYVMIKDKFGRLDTYMHLKNGSPNKYGLKQGESLAVKAGDPIGEVGCTGGTTGTHIHFEVAEGDEELDPFAGKQSGAVSLWTDVKATGLPPIVSYADICPNFDPVPGGFADGIHKATSAAPSRAFQMAHGWADWKTSVNGLTSTRVGCPVSEVHSVDGVWLQDYQQINGDPLFEGSDGKLLLALPMTTKPHPEAKCAVQITKPYLTHWTNATKASFLVRSGFLAAYKCLHQQNNDFAGPAILGAPINNEHSSNCDCMGENVTSITRQDFEKGCMWWGSSQPNEAKQVHVHVYSAASPIIVKPECKEVIGDLVVPNPPGAVQCVAQEQACADTVDNDCDGFTDANDADCPGEPSTPCPTWDFSSSPTLDWTLSNGATVKGPLGSWSIDPDVEDPFVSIGISGPVSEKCGVFAARLKSKCAAKSGFAWFRASKKVAIFDTQVDCAKEIDENKIPVSVDCDGEWCQFAVNFAGHLCWEEGGPLTNLRFDFAEQEGLGNDCSAGPEDIVELDWIKLQQPCTASMPCYSGSDGTQKLGICKGGNQTCAEGVLSLKCSGQVTPATEGCNGLDDNCDGIVDEGCATCDPSQCDDSNVCTNEKCDGNTCKNMPVGDGAGCTDNNPCTDSDACSGGKCTPGPIKDCSDNNPCTEDVCDPKSGGCKNSPKSGPCTDGDPCTTDDACDAGSCKSGSPKSCDDGDQCTKDMCQSGNCKHEAICLCKAATDCDDKNSCTDEACEGGACKNSTTGQEGKSCNTTDKCQQTGTGTCTAGICKSGNQPISCSGMANACQDAACNPATGKCEVVAKADGASCDADSSACTANDSCQSGVCKAGQLLVCTDTNPCTDTLCDSKAGCVTKNNTAPCDDNNACTLNDVCSSGNCQPGTPAPCKDDDPCTDDNCDKPKGCVHPPAPNSTPCTTVSNCSKLVFSDGGVCQNGKCVAGTKNCDDGNPCTDDACDPKVGCTTQNNTALCDDQNACTTGDVCANAACQPGSSKVCSDGNPCTTDGCDKGKGCTFSNVGVGTPCGSPGCVGLSYAVTPTCASGVCQQAAKQDCNDANPCTNDTCSVTSGCNHLPNAEVCDDGNACTVLDKCTMGKCQSGAVKVCSDANPCTIDGCDKGTGCSFPAQADGTLCSSSTCDGQAYTAAAACKSGICQLAPAAVVCDDKNPCTVDACDPVKGCMHSPAVADCSDNDACSIGDKCQNNKCVAGTKVVCDDGNSCTSDVCDPAKGCTSSANSALCSDGNLCTTNDICAAGKCSGGPSVICDDKDPCTTDSCSPSVGCSAKPGNDGAACSDNNACTVSDACAAGTCKGAGKDCNDNNVCTTDKCNPATQGCFYEAVADGDPCAGPTCPSTSSWQPASKCQSGKCEAAPAPIGCDDKNVCTIDSCNAQLGCQHALASSCTDNNLCTDDKCDQAKGCLSSPNAAGCDDGNACTKSDTCTLGVCQGQTATCNDGNPCTVDSCDQLKGCVFTATTGACDADGKACTADSCIAGKCQVGQTSGENCCNGIDDDCDGETDECGIPLFLQYGAPVADTALKLVYQASPDGAWQTINTAGPNAQATVKVCPGTGTIRLNMNWVTAIDGRTWGCDSDTKDRVEPVGMLPIVDVNGVPASVALVPGADGRKCDFAVGIANGVPADPVVARPGVLLVNSANLGNADCAILVGDHGDWLSGPVVAKQSNGFYSFKLPGGRMPTGVWRFNVAKPAEGCSIVGSTGSVAPGKPISEGGAWANSSVAGMTKVGLTWAWAGDTMEWGSAVPSGSWRMLALPSGAILPAGSASPLDPSLAYCKAGATRACSTKGCSLEQTCLQHGWPFEAVAASTATWSASFWSDCSPKAASIPIVASDNCGDGKDSDCDGMDELCGGLVDDGDFEAYTGNGQWASWVGTSGATVAIVADVVARGVKALLVEVPTASKEFWVAQVQNKSVSVEKGKVYRLAFWASANKVRTLRVTLEHPVNANDPKSPWLCDGLATDFDLAPGMRRYEVNFLATTTGTRQLNFQFAQANGKVWIDGVTIAQAQFQ